MVSRSSLLSLLLGPCLLVAAESTPKQYRDFATRREASAVRGRELFFRNDKAACSACHSIDGTHSKAGPDLQSVGDALGRRELIEAVLEPNASISIGYEAALVEMHSNEAFFGVIKNANSAAVELMHADGTRVRLAREEIKTIKPSDRSFMPEDLHTSLSLQEFADVIEYLVHLKQPASALAMHQGMPDTIPRLVKPIAVRPLLPEALRFPMSVVRRPGDVRLGLVWVGAFPGSDALVAAHQSGRVWLLDKSAGEWVKTPFADFSAEVYSLTGPNGLLGVAFHPQFLENGKYYLKHQVFEAGQIVATVVEKIAASDRRTDSGTPSRRLLAIPCVTQNHTGGCIAFGPDGFLYIGMGDTGPQQDPNGHGQDPGLLLGKLLRIDVDRREGSLPYAIPSDNPFRENAGVRPEIWAFGFREPWRFSFDPATGDLWVGDVGQDRVEEIAIVRRGENHGWNVFEGFQPFSNQRRTAGTHYVPPVFAYKRRYGNSVTGGYVFRGDGRSSFHGVYVFGDYTSKLIFGLREQNRQLQVVHEIGTAPESIASFGTDARGGIFIVSYEGMIYELDFAGAEFEREPATPAAAHPVALPVKN